ncbi:MAG: LuxR C-terminal-related transcriptional regulator [Spirochaetia bacterium]|jgi:DNA-binding CsgD family transcriptional regulator|nr:LuxR C-terminal-related transcriptional regulator [Spirochaetia bacterium]
MLVEAVKTYSNLTTTDIQTFSRIIYLVFNPIGEIIQFLMFPAVAFAATGKKVPFKLNIISKLYALLMVATFPIEAITGSSSINLAREFLGQTVFHIYAYVVILRYYSNILNPVLRKALKSYLILALVVVPPAIIFQSGILARFITQQYLDIPFPYIFYCLLFNILCIVNTFRYLFIPAAGNVQKIPEGFLSDYNITKREEEIIDLLLSGYNNKQIASKLFISNLTVKNHIYSIYQKTNVHNRMQLVNSIKAYHSIQKK